MKLVKYLLPLLLISSVFGCSQYRPRKTAAKYVDIVTDRAKPTDTRAADLMDIITDYDQAYLRDISAVFLSKDHEVWLDHFKHSIYKYIELDFFSQGLAQNKNDTTEFSLLVLEEIIKREEHRFLSAEYLETNVLSDSNKIVVYTVPLPGFDEVQARPIPLSKQEGAFKVLLDMRMAVLNRSLKKIYQSRKRTDLYYWEKEVNKLIEALYAKAY